MPRPDRHRGAGERDPRHAGLGERTPYVPSPSDVVTGAGALFKRGDGASSESFVAISEVRSIVGPVMTREVIDITNRDVEEEGCQFVSGYRDGGQLTVSMNFTYGVYDYLLSDLEEDDPHNYQVVLADDGESTLDIAGYVVDLQMNTATDDAVTCDVVIKVTGEVGLTA